MTKEELAARLNGRDLDRTIVEDEEKELARESKLLIVYGQSDDLVELEGFIDEEIISYDAEEEICIDFNFKVMTTPDEDDAETLERYNVLDIVNERMKRALKITAKCQVAEDEGYTGWTFEVAVPHATFDLMDSDELDDENDQPVKYCRGIVIDMKTVDFLAACSEEGTAATATDDSLPELHVRF